MERSVEFYSLLFDMEPSARVLDRWAQFDLDGGCFGVFNQMFDYKVLISDKSNDAMFNKAYVNRLGRHKTIFGNNIIHHFRVDDLSIEYNRLLSLNIGQLSDILYVNVSFPYSFFTLSDPDGNIIEITGNYSEATDSADVSSGKSKGTRAADTLTSSAKSTGAGATAAVLFEKPEVEVSVEPVKLHRAKKSAPLDEEPPVAESMQPESEPPAAGSVQPEIEPPAIKSIRPGKEPPITESVRPGKEPPAAKSVRLEKEPSTATLIRPDKEPTATKSIQRDEDLPFKTFIKASDESPAILPIEPENNSVDYLEESVVVQPDRDVSIEEIRYKVQDDSSSMPAETFIDHSILRAAILKERERQIREQANGIPIFKPIEPEPEPEVAVVETIEKGSEPTESGEAKPSKQERAERNRPIWDEPAKNLWRDE
jgi:lactoylglutathione lyase